MKRYESYKDSGQQWPKQIPSNWNFISTKYILRQKRTIVGHNSSRYDLLSLSLKGVVKRDLENPTGKFPTSFDGYQEVKKGDFVFCLFDNEETPRTVGLSSFNGMITGAYDVLECYNRDIISRYLLYYYLNIDEGKRMKPLYKGLRKTIPMESFMAFKIPIPSISEQDAIVSYLDTVTADIDKAIDQQQRMVDLLNERKQIIIQKELLPGVGQKGKTDMWFGALPPKWHSIRLKYILAERNERSETGSEEPLSMSQKYGLIPTSQMDVIPNMAASFVGAKKAYVGDLVFNKLKAHLGVFAVSNYNGLVSPDYAVYYANSKVNLKYLQFLFKNPMMIAEFRRRSSGVGEGLTRLYTKDLFSIYIPLPSLEEQNRVVENIEIMTRQIANHIAFCENTIKLLQERKRIIINNVVTGKVKVS